MRCYTKQHPLYGGLDGYARSMYVCILRQAGAILVPRTMKAAPEPWRKAGAPHRARLGVAGACRFTWEWLADRCRHAGLPFVLGQALSLQASHGGKAKHDTRDALQRTGRLRGGMLPHA